MGKHHYIQRQNVESIRESTFVKRPWLWFPPPSCIIGPYASREREWEATGLKQQWLCDLDVWLEKKRFQLTDTQGLAWAFYMQLCLLDSTCSLLSWFEGTNPVRWGAVDTHRSARLESCPTSSVNMSSNWWPSIIIQRENPAGRNWSELGGGPWSTPIACAYL